MKYLLVICACYLATVGERAWVDWERLKIEDSKVSLEVLMMIQKVRPQTTQPEIQKPHNPLLPEGQRMERL